MSLEEPAMSSEPASESAVTFDERLWVPWWWWLMAVLVVAMLGAEVHIGLGWTVAVVTYAVLGAVVLVLLLRWARPVQVRDGALQVLARSVPLSRVTEVRTLGRDDVRGALAARPEEAAVVLLRGYVRHAVQVSTDGDGDVPPYLVISTRRPAELVAALGAGEPRLDGAR